ncbi:MAG: hypothetical protein GX051_01080 [Clostridiales bacterium]|nr:hypothetical protein [Clostridiales bacterium]
MNKSTKAKRIFSAALAVFMLLSAFPIVASAEDYILINNEAELKNIADDMSASYKLNADISVSAWTAPIGGATEFTGVLEGNGKTISGLNITVNDNSSSSVYAGLFSKLGGTVKNLKLSGKVTATATNNSSATLYAGSIAGYCGLLGSIECCQTSVAVSATLSPTAATGSWMSSYTGKVYAGGICGYYGAWFYMSECANKGAVTANCTPAAASGKTANATAYVGGIAGYAGSVENCYNNQSITGKATANGSAACYAGGVVGQGSTVKTSYSSGNKISGTAEDTNYVGGVAGELYSASYCYFHKDSATLGIGHATNSETPATATGLSSSGMNGTKMSGFDYDNVWASSPLTPPALILPEKLISGSVKIEGTAEFSRTLTANITAVEPADARESLRYQWYRCSEISGSYTLIEGATSSTYNLKEADIGMYIRVVVKGKYYKLFSNVYGYGGSVRSSAVGTVAKLTPSTPAAPAVASTTATSVTLVASSGCQYGISKPSIGWFGTSWGGITWQDSPTFEALTEGTTYRFYQRVKETTTTKASAQSEALEAEPEAHVEPVAISGTVKVSDTTPAVGQTISADVSSLTPNNITFSYQWYRGTSPISGASSSAYTVAAADYGKQLKVVVTAAQTGYTGSRESALTSKAAACTISGSVTINGTLTVGQTLTANTNGVAPAGISLSYQWYRGTLAISGANTKSYELTPNDFDKTIKVVVTANQTGYTGSLESSTANTVAAAAISGTVSITMSGLSPVVGQTVTANTENVTPSGASLAYQWYRGSVAISGATSKTYIVAPEDYNNKLKVSVTANGRGYTGELTSAQTFFGVGAATLGGTVSISGILAVGKTLTAQTENITPSGITAFNYQWYRGDTKINGATTKTYVPVAADTGAILKVVVSAQQNCYTGSVSGTAVSAISAVEKTVSSISVTTPPTKTNYNVGDNFDKSGMVVKATYTDNTSSVIADYTVRGGTNLQVGTTYVTVEYLTFSARVAVSVNVPADRKITSSYFVISDAVLKGVPAGTKVSEILAKVSPSVGVKAYDLNGREMAASALIGTGCTLRLTVGGSVVDTVTVAVKGDLNGDGIVMATDARLALRAATSLEVLTAAQNSAGAIAGGKKPTASDARTILRVATKLQNF